MINKELEAHIVTFTDAGAWKSSWHWPRGRHGSLTKEGAEKALHDLGCRDLHDEMQAACRHIRARYELAEELRELLAKWPD